MTPAQRAQEIRAEVNEYVNAFGEDGGFAYLIDAARTIALPILEGDARQRIHRALDRKLRHPLSDVYTAIGVDTVIAQLTSDILIALVPEETP